MFHAKKLRTETSEATREKTITNVENSVFEQEKQVIMSIYKVSCLMRTPVFTYAKASSVFKPVPIVQMVERPLREREVVGLNPGRAIPKTLKMVSGATLLGAQHYKASTGSPLTHF